MADTQEQKNEQEVEQNDVENSDESVAEYARKLISEKDKVIEDLKRENAKLKVTIEPKKEVERVMSQEEARKIIGESKTVNYDYAVAVVELRKRCLEAGEKDPLGANGQAVAQHFEKIINACNGDKSKFSAFYQAYTAEDETEDALRYAKAISNK